MILMSDAPEIRPCNHFFSPAVQGQLTGALRSERAGRFGEAHAALCALLGMARECCTPGSSACLRQVRTLELELARCETSLGMYAASRRRVQLLAESLEAHEVEWLIACKMLEGMNSKFLADFARASDSYGIVKVKLEECGGDPAPLFADLYHNLAGLEHAQGNLSFARRLAERGLAFRARDNAEGASIRYAADLSANAAIVMSLNELEHAEDLLRTALYMTSVALGKDHYEVGMIYINLGTCLHHMGRFDEAAHVVRKAVAILRDAVGPEHPDVGLALHNLAVLDYDRGRSAEARAGVLEARRLLQGSLPNDHPRMRQLMETFALLSGTPQ